MKLLWSIAVFVVLLGTILLAGMCVKYARSETIKVQWTNPSFNSDSLNCMLADSTRPLTDLAGIKVWGVNYKTNDTLYFGSIPTTKAGRLDSADFEINPNIVGELLFKPYDTRNNLTCRPWHYIFTTKYTEVVPVIGGLTGEYYRWIRDVNGIRQFSNFIIAIGDTTIDFDWGFDSPSLGVPVDSFCVRWTGQLNVPTTGTYVSYISSEDGFRYWIDGTLVRDNWIVTFEQEWGNVLNLSAGLHNIKIEYFANLGHSACHWKWSGPGISKQIVARKYLTP